MSKNEVSKKIGSLYIMKSSVNLMFDILSVSRECVFYFAWVGCGTNPSFVWLSPRQAPDYFWDYGGRVFCHACPPLTLPRRADHLSVIYARVRKIVDIDSRVEVMNKRLDVLEQLLEILRAEKTEQHAVRPGFF